MIGATDRHRPADVNVGRHDPMMAREVKREHDYLSTCGGGRGAQVAAPSVSAATVLLASRYRVCRCRLGRRSPLHRHERR